MRSPKHDVAFVPSLSGALVQAGGGSGFIDAEIQFIFERSLSREL